MREHEWDYVSWKVVWPLSDQRTFHTWRCNVCGRTVVMESDPQSLRGPKPDERETTSQGTPWDCDLATVQAVHDL